MWTLIVIIGTIAVGLFLFNLTKRSGGGGGFGGFGGGKKKCGYCRSWVNASESHCPRCGYEFIEF